MTKINLIAGFLHVRMEKHWEIPGVFNDICGMRRKMCNLLGKALEKRLLKQHISVPLLRIKRTNWVLFISFHVLLSPTKNYVIEKLVSL